MNAPTRQTASFLRRRFEEAGVRPRTRYGQCFLIDLNLLDILADAAELTSNDVVLEVGTGTGSLTQTMASRAAAVVTVEIDRELFQLASEELYALKNVVMLQMDALKNKNRLNPAVLDTVYERLDAEPGRRFQVAANLPYNVATPILSNLLALDRAPQAMTVTIQKEVADRLVAQPGTKDYGSLSIWVQSQCTAEVVRVLPPTAFWPRPKVDSAIVRIVLDPARREAIPDRSFFHDFIRGLFCHRRKFLRSELVSCFKGRLEKPQVDAILESANLPPETRAEQLDVESVLRLCAVCRRELGSG